MDEPMEPPARARAPRNSPAHAHAGGWPAVRWHLPFTFSFRGLPPKNCVQEPLLGTEKCELQWGASPSQRQKTVPQWARLTLTFSCRIFWVFFCQNVPLPGNALHFASGDNVLLEQPFSRVTGFPSPTQGSRAHHAQFQTSPSPGPPPPPGAREAGSSSDGLGLAFFWEAAREAANPLDLGHKSVIC